MSEQAQAAFTIEKIYVKDLSVEVPGAPEVFLEEEAPQVEIQLQSEGRGLGNSFYDVTLTVTVTAKRGDKGAFLVEVAQAGIFRIEGVPEEQVEPLLAVACPNILFPYAREVMSDATTRAGFAPVILAPVNFEALYMSRLQEQAEQAEGSLQ
ncbi:protein-export chaperone SecB [Oryzomicrobium sp.]|uniref:protein-export chaperone SecB n=1 Tax=Oryzomicrobium sp. TaxID=1911578 RepID=UPI0025CFF68C|nr:protein-export chaperone SecB [Oryzomicrobium sp.]MCE1244698.1 protein-export chaperone SecB [Oryzomicrobium sp.]